MIIITTAFVFGYMPGNNRAWLIELADPALITSTITIGVVIIYIIIPITYFTYFHGISGRTPRKMLLSLQVLYAEGTLINFEHCFFKNCRLPDLQFTVYHTSWFYPGRL
jgi:hypothetical protein